MGGIERRYELRIQGRSRPASWLGYSPENAIERYLDSRRVAGDDPLPVVVAWRVVDQLMWDVSVLGNGIIVG